jgi:hypothetical protein
MTIASRLPFARPTTPFDEAAAVFRAFADALEARVGRGGEGRRRREYPSPPGEGGRRRSRRPEGVVSVTHDPGGPEMQPHPGPAKRLPASGSPAPSTFGFASPPEGRDMTLSHNGPTPSSGSPR